MISRPLLLSVAIAVCFAALAPPVAAQVAPTLGYVYPPAIQAGVTTNVQLGGYDFTDDLEVFVHSDQLVLEVLGPPGRFFVPEPPYWFGPKGFTTAYPIPQEIPARITFQGDVTPGLKHWQVANVNGSSSTAVFYVSNHREIVEERFRDQSVQRLTELPVGVSGRIRKIAEVDRYEIRAERDGPITVELFARRLGANMNGVLKVRDDNDRLIGDVADTEGVDAALTFAAKQGRAYTVSLHDADFRGNRGYVYRLSVHAGPRIVATVPAAGRRGETRDIRFVGYGLATGGSDPESVTRSVTFPSDATRTSVRYELKTAFGAASVEIPLSEQPERAVLKAEKQPIDFQTPGAVTALLNNRHEDRYACQLKKGELWDVRLQSRAIGGALDVVLGIEDASGKQLASNDDFSGSPDAALQFKAPKDGGYRLVVGDTSGRTGDELAVYRLSMSPVSPDYQLTSVQQAKVTPGGTVQLAIKAKRFAGMKEAIALHVDGLPEGISVPSKLEIPAGKNDAKIALTLGKDAASIAGLIQVRGECKVGERTVVRYAEAPLSGNLCPRTPNTNVTNKLLLSTQLAAPFTLELVDKNRQRSVHRGTTYPAPFLVKRKEGFNGEVVLRMASKQGRHRQGIRGPRITVPPGVEEVFYPCFMPEWLATDRTTRMVVVGEAKVPDGKGRSRIVSKMADARVTMILEGALLKLSSRPAEVTVRPGESFQAPLALSRSAKLATTVRVEMVPPVELKGLLEAAEMSVPASQNELDVTVETKSAAELRGAWKIKFRATAMQDGKWPAVSETDVMVVFERPAEAGE